VLADRILVIGDSGAAPLAAELQTVLHENGHTDITVDATPFIGQSSQMRTTGPWNIANSVSLRHEARHWGIYVSNFFRAQAT
jgi:hypothetical protein